MAWSYWLLAGCLFQAFALQGQIRPFFQHFTEKDGLSSDNVTCILREREGYLWVGTNYGLNRYDGRQFRHFLPDNSRPDQTVCHEHITALAPDDDGYIWIATRKGLNRYNPRNGRFQTWHSSGKGDDTLPSDLVCGLLPDGKVLWIVCDNRDLTYLDRETGHFHSLPWKKFTERALPAQKDKDYKNIRRVLKKSDTQLWLETNLGLMVYDKSNGQFALCHEPKTTPSANTGAVPEGTIQALYTDFQGLRWFGGENGLWLLDPALQHFGFLSLDKGSTTGRYARLLDLPDYGRRLISDTEAGKMLVFEGNHLLKTLDTGGPCHVLQRDAQGNIWVSGGLDLFQLDPKTWKLNPFPIKKGLFDAVEESFLSDLEVDASGDIWLAGSDCGLILYRSATKTWEKPGPEQDFIARNINCLFADPEGRYVWIGTEDYGLFRYDCRTRLFTLFQPDQADPQHSLGAYMVKDIGGFQGDFLWVSTDPGGLSRYDYHAQQNPIFLNYNTASGLPSNQVYSILNDAAGRLWAGASKGLIFMGENGTNPVFWNKNSGLIRENLDMPLSLGTDGNIYIGGVGGMTFFNPDSLLGKRRSPKILLNAFKLFGRDAIDTIQDEIVLSWRDNFFTVEFTSDNFSMPERNLYSACLQGFDPYPQNLGNQGYCVFTNVPPGKYLLQFGAARNDGTRAQKTLRIIIVPAFWQTRWFQWLLGALALAAVWGAYRYHIGRIRREERLKTEFNRRLSQVEMSALRAQMNPHFVFNCLNSINRYILINEPEVASEYLSKFSRLIRLILDNSRSDTVPLDKELDALRLYIEMEAMRFEGRFEYELKIDPSLQPQHIEIPPLLIQPYVENAIWHGLMHRQEPGKLSINIDKINEEGGLRIRIEDNGIGRARAQELRSKSAQTHKSHGMQLTEERLEMIRNLFGVNAGITIEDLFTPEHTPAGTRVTIHID